jgi:hypothetical protein
MHQLICIFSFRFIIQMSDVWQFAESVESNSVLTPALPIRAKTFLQIGCAPWQDAPLCPSATLGIISQTTHRPDLLSNEILRSYSEVFGLNLGLIAEHPDLNLSWFFSPESPVKCRVRASIKPRPLPSKSFQIHRSFIQPI